MNAAQLRDTTLDPRARVLLKVNIESQLEADATFHQLLGKDASESVIESSCRMPRSRTIWTCEGCHCKRNANARKSGERRSDIANVHAFVVVRHALPCNTLSERVRKQLQDFVRHRFSI